MPTFRHGKSAFFSITDNVPTGRDISNVLDSVSFPESIETADTTAFGSTSKSYIVGLKDSTISISGKFDATVDGYLSGMLGYATLAAYVYGPAGNTAGYVKLSGSAIITSYSLSSPVGDVISFSCDLQNSGAVTRGTF